MVLGNRGRNGSERPSKLMGIINQVGAGLSLKSWEKGLNRGGYFEPDNKEKTKWPKQYQ